MADNMQALIDMNERLQKIEKDLLILSGNIDAIVDGLKLHQHLNTSGVLSGPASTVVVSKLFEQ